MAALSSPAPALLLLVLTCGGCLVTDPLEFPQPENHEPRVEEMNPALLELTRIDSTTVETFRLVARIRDANVEDRLEGRVFIDYSLGNDGIQQVPTIRTEADDPEVRLVETTLSPRRFRRGCHVVEVDVVDDPAGWDSGLSPSNRGLREGTGHVTLTWFILAHAGPEDDGSDIALEVCPWTSAGSSF